VDGSDPLQVRDGKTVTWWWPTVKSKTPPLSSYDERQIPLALARKLVNEAKLDGRSQTFTAGSEPFGLKPQCQGMLYRRLRFISKEFPYTGWPDQHCCDLVGYVDGAQLTKDEIEGLERVMDLVSLAACQVTGKWTKGSFLVTRVTEIKSSKVLLDHRDVTPATQENDRVNKGRPVKGRRAGQGGGNREPTGDGGYPAGRGEQSVPKE
jgi:hypothetical protein